MKMLVPTLLVAAAVGFTASACSEGVAHETAPPSDPVDGIPVTVTEIADVIPVRGTTRARKRAELSTRLMAQVSQVAVEIGDRVRTGQVLIQLGTADIAANRMKAEAGIVAAQAAFDEAERQAARMDTLYAQDVVALVQRDQARLGRTQAASQLAMANASLDEVVTAAGYARMSAPFPARVVARNVDPGDLAAPGRPLLILESEGPRDGLLAVPVDVAGTLETGAAIEVVTASGSRAMGKVRAVAGGADARTRTVDLLVELPEEWPTGVSITGNLPVGTREALLIPNDAVVRRGQLTGVELATDTGVVLRWVRLGRSVGHEVEVISGLDADDRIVR